MNNKDHILIGFSTDKSDLVSKIIRVITWSRFSHVVLINPDKSSFIESTHGVGVRELPIRDFLKRDGVEIGRIEHPYPDKIWELAKEQIGKPYDTMYIYGWLLHRNWQDDAKWACCELIPAMAIKTGYPVIRCEECIKITPEMLYMISTPLEKGGLIK